MPCLQKGNFWVLVQIFDAHHISATRISAPKRLAVVVNTKILFNTDRNIFLELRRVSLRYDNREKFGLVSMNKIEEEPDRLNR